MAEEKFKAPRWGQSGAFKVRLSEGDRKTVLELWGAEVLASVESRLDKLEGSSPEDLISGVIGGFKDAAEKQGSDNVLKVGFWDQILGDS